MAEFDPDKYLEKKKTSDEFDPDKYLASKKPETPLQTFGRSAASLADTALNAVTGTLDYGAYALARAAGRTPTQATQETTSPKDVVGRAFGVTGTPGYENAPLRSLGTAIGETVGENVVQPIASATGLPESDVSNMLTSVSMGVAPVVPKVVKPAVQGAKTAGEFVSQVPGGMLGRATGYIAKPGETPKGYQVESSRIPLTETFTKPEDWSAFQRGQLPYGQFPPETPIQQLPSNAIERTALKLSGGEIPAAGQAGRAFGERLGETYRNPVTAAIDIGSLFATGVPFMTAARGGLAALQGGADALLARKGFDPRLPRQMEAYRSGQIPMPGTPPAPVAGPVTPQPAPTSTALTVQGPGQQLPPSIIPMPAPQRNVNIEGQSFTIPRDINVANSQTARAPQTPAQVSMQAAASKIQPAPQTPVAGQVAPTPQPKPVVQPTPKVEGMRSSAEIKKELDMIGRQSDELHTKGLEEGIQYGTPQGESHQAQLGQFNARIKVLEKELEEALKAEKKANKPSKKGPSNVSQMLVGEPKPTGKMNEALVSKRSFNSDLQKYRYGSEKNPLTMDEFNHLKQSDFLEHQNTRDILMDMRPDLTEYSIWYKDKTGKIHNVQTHGGELDKFRKIK